MLINNIKINIKNIYIFLMFSKCYSRNNGQMFFSRNELKHIEMLSFDLDFKIKIKNEERKEK